MSDPSPASNTIRARSTRPAFITEDRTHFCSSARSLSGITKGAARMHNSIKHDRPIASGAPH
jgi:hypothetical protein